MYDKGKGYKVSHVEVSNSYSPSGILRIHSCSQSNKSKLHKNPIDEFADSALALRRYTGNKRFDYRMAGLALVGHISLAERYFRRIISRCIQEDALSKEISSAREIYYGASIYLEGVDLADAVAERYVFSGEKGIRDAIKDCLGLSLDRSLDPILYKFDMVCQLRHCIVHRYGEIGTKNTISLGIHEHNSLIGNEIRIDFSNSEAAIEIVDVMVRSINDVIFSSLVSRQFAYNLMTGDYRKDTESFNRLYALFKAGYNGLGSSITYYKFTSNL